MNKEFYKTPTSLIALVLIIGFFLPWISLGNFISISGYEIPKTAELLDGIARSFSENPSSSIKLYYILYLIPILSAYLLYGEYQGKQMYFVPVKIFIFSIFIFIIYKINSTGNDIGFFEKTDIGLWISIAGIFFLGIQIIQSFQEPVSENENSKTV
jgi:hypothetical protein